METKKCNGATSTHPLTLHWEGGGGDIHFAEKIFYYRMIGLCKNIPRNNTQPYHPLKGPVLNVAFVLGFIYVSGYSQ